VRCSGSCSAAEARYLSGLAAGLAARAEPATRSKRNDICVTPDNELASPRRFWLGTLFAPTIEVERPVARASTCSMHCWRRAPVGLDGYGADIAQQHGWCLMLRDTLTVPNFIVETIQVAKTRASQGKIHPPLAGRSLPPTRVTVPHPWRPAMPSSSQESIQAAFDQLGLGTDADRQRFRNLGKPVGLPDERHFSIRFDIGSTSSAPEGTDAKLAPAAGRDQGQGQHV